MRKSPTIHVDKDPASPYYNLLQRWDYPGVCQNGFDEDSGIKYLSALLGFLVVFRFVNVYSRYLCVHGPAGRGSGNCVHQSSASVCSGRCVQQDKG